MAGTDEEAIAAAGIEPIRAQLAAIDAIESAADARALAPQLERDGVGAFYGIGIAPDFADANAYLVYVGQGGLGLPDRDYYLKDDERSTQLLEAYRGHVATQLGNLGIAPDEALAARGRDHRVRAPARGGVAHPGAAARPAADAQPPHDGRARRAHAALAPRGARARGRRHAAHGERRLPGLLPRPRRGDRRHARRRPAPLPPLAGREDLRVRAAARVRGRLVRASTGRCSAASRSRSRAGSASSTSRPRTSASSSRSCTWRRRSRRPPRTAASTSSGTCWRRWARRSAPTRG